MDGDLGQHLAVHLDLGFAQAVHQFRVAHALEPRGGVDAGDPEAAEGPLFVTPVAVGVHARPLHLLFGKAVGGVLASEVALRFLQHLAALLARVDGALDAAHLPPRSRVRTFFWSLGAMSTGFAIFRFRFGDFFSRVWLEKARRPRSLPVAVFLKRFLAPEWVFIFGIGLGIEADDAMRARAAPRARVRWRPMRILYVVGTRPNFVKTAPVIGALRARNPEGRHAIVHTGQHYDRLMSEVFLEELGVPEPDHMLEVGSGSHAQQTARVMERLEPVLVEARPDLVMVPGDVNSTLAAAL